MHQTPFSSRRVKQRCLQKQPSGQQSFSGRAMGKWHSYCCSCYLLPRGPKMSLPADKSRQLQWQQQIRSISWQLDIGWKSIFFSWSRICEQLGRFKERIRLLTTLQGGDDVKRMVRRCQSSEFTTFCRYERCRLLVKLSYLYWGEELGLE